MPRDSMPEQQRMVGLLLDFKILILTFSSNAIYMISNQCDDQLQGGKERAGGHRHNRAEK